MTGMMACRICPNSQLIPVPLTSVEYTNGSQSSVTEKIRMNKSPVKKVGNEKPMKASVLAIWSKIE